MLEDIISNVHRPAQYLGNEWNASKKDFDSSFLRVALGFPDLYEIGMSNLGLRIIYGILNNIEDVTCERFFAPEEDLEKALKDNGRRLFSLETNRALSDFDILGFSLGSELNYTNVLNMIELSGLALQSGQRDNADPLVIGGGPCALNPEPMADFFDLFIIGEAEEAIVELLNIYRRLKENFKQGKISKEALLIELSKVEGVYAPSLYGVEYDHQGELKNFSPKIKGLPGKIKKRVVADLDSAYFPCIWLTPYVQTIHDRITLEISRGCPHRCRFCQARTQYYPLRNRKKENVIALAKKAYDSSGYEEISLTGLSVSDYPNIVNLVSELTDLFKEDAVNLSLPSLKAKSLLGNVSTLIAKIKKTGLTFAPEAGTQRLRQVVAKDFLEDEFFAAVEEAYRAGYQHLKLYFLIGLPTENEDDLAGIINFARKSSELKRKVQGGPAQINISINPLIPKPHTPLQWLKMDSIEANKEKQSYFYSGNKNRRLKFNFHNLQMAHLEGVLSRGNRKLSRVILAAYKKGAKFDAWSNYFSYLKWQEAFAEEGIDPQKYLDQKPISALLAWDFIDTGISKDILAKEYNLAVSNNLG